MKIGNKEYSEIHVTDDEGNLVVSISDENIIQHDDYKVLCVPVEN